MSAPDARARALAEAKGVVNRGVALAEQWQAAVMAGGHKTADVGVALVLLERAMLSHLPPEFARTWDAREKKAIESMIDAHVTTMRAPKGAKT